MALEEKHKKQENLKAIRPYSPKLANNILYNWFSVDGDRYLLMLAAVMMQRSYLVHGKKLGYPNALTLIGCVLCSFESGYFHRESIISLLGRKSPNLKILIRYGWIECLLIKRKRKRMYRMTASGISFVRTFSSEQLKLMNMYGKLDGLIQAEVDRFGKVFTGAAEARKAMKWLKKKKVFVRDEKNKARIKAYEEVNEVYDRKKEALVQKMEEEIELVKKKRIDRLEKATQKKLLELSKIKDKQKLSEFCKTNRIKLNKKHST